MTANETNWCQYMLEGIYPWIHVKLAGPTADKMIRENMLNQVDGYPGTREPILGGYSGPEILDIRVCI